MVSVREISMFHRPYKPGTYAEVNEHTYGTEEVLADDIYKFDIHTSQTGMGKVTHRKIQIPFIYIG